MKYEVREKTALGFVRIVATYNTLYAAVRDAEERSKKVNISETSVSNRNRKFVMFYRKGKVVVF